MRASTGRLISLAIALAAAPAFADQFNYTGASNGDWNTGASWTDINTSTTGFVPSGADDAALSGKIVNVTQQAQFIGNLYLGYTMTLGGTTSGSAATLNIAGSAGLTGGDASNLSLANGSTLNMSNGNGILYSADRITIGALGAASTANVSNGAEMSANHFNVDLGSHLTIDGGHVDVSLGFDISNGAVVTVKNGGNLGIHGGEFFVGDTGTASLLIQLGGHLTTTNFSCDSGSVTTIDGQNSFISSDVFFVAGNLTIQNAAFASANICAVAGNGTATVTGGLSTWNAQSLAVGLSSFGAGTLLVQSGALVTASSAQVDFNSTITVNGTGSFGGASSLSIFGNFNVGYSNKATLTVSAGGYISDLNGFLGYQSGSTGSALVTGANSLWTNSQGLFINTNGNLTITNGGQVTAAFASAAAGTILNVATNSSMIVTGNFANSANATVSGSLTLGSISGAGSITNNGSITFTNSGTVTVTNTISGTGSLNMNGTGTLSIGTASSSFSGPLNVNSGTFKFGGGIFSQVPINIAVAGTVDLNVSSITTPTLTGSGTLDNLQPSGFATLIVNGSTSCTFFGNIHGGTNITRSGTGTLNLYGTNTYSGLTTINSGATLVLGSTGALPINGNITNNGTLKINANIVGGHVTGTGTTIIAPGANFFTDFTQGSLINNGAIVMDGASAINTISGNGTLSVSNAGTLTLGAAPANAASIVGNLTLAGTTNAWTATLDLSTNAMAIQTTSAADKNAKRLTLVNQIKTGFNNGDWLGHGITSSAAQAKPNGFGYKAVGIFDNANFNTPLTTLGPGGPAIDTSTLIIAQAYGGDANFDGKVDILDLTVVANHWQANGTDWANGDFDGTGFVDVLDLTAVANNWQIGVPPGTSQLSFAQALAEFPNLTGTPEPASLALFASAIPLLLRRRCTHK